MDFLPIMLDLTLDTIGIDLVLAPLALAVLRPVDSGLRWQKRSYRRQIGGLSISYSQLEFQTD